MAKLKVFTWSDGFHAFTVATTSKPKALQAWGIGGDIFKTGLASEITEGPDHDAALKSPGEVIERGLAIDVGKMSKARKPKLDAASVKARARIAALESDLAGLDDAQAAETATMDTRRAALEKEAEALAASQDTARKTVLAKLKTARSKV